MEDYFPPFSNSNAVERYMNCRSFLVLTNGFLGWMVGAKLALDDKKKSPYCSQ